MWRSSNTSTRWPTRARLRSNTKVGTFLSGGLDSSYVTAVAASMQPLDLAAFTLYVPGTKHLDERPFAPIVADHCGIPLTEVDTTDCWYLSSRWLSPERLISHTNRGPALRL